MVSSYLQDLSFCSKYSLVYVPTSITGRLISRLLFTFCSYIRILKELLPKRTNIVHVHMSEKGSVFRKGIVIFLAKIFRSKTIIHLHGAIFEVWYKSSKPYIQAMVRRIMNSSDLIIILGKYWSDFISSLVTTPEKIHILYNAIRTSTENRYNPKSRNILFLGVLDKRKGIYDLLEAMSIAKDHLPKGISLTIYGQDTSGDINDRILYNNLENIVFFNGYLREDQKKEVFSNSLINILPSYNEGMPMTILETMAFGIPNISTNIAGIPEIIQDGENGILIRPGDPQALAEAIILLITNEEKRIEMSEKAFMTMRTKFSYDKHSIELDKLYASLIGDDNQITSKIEIAN